MSSSDPNQPVQNYEIVNSTLEQQVAALLPSVAGYGGNLRATNTIIPIVDLTSAAEGSTLPAYLQRAWGFETTFNRVRATTTTIINSTGFWQCSLTASYSAGSATSPKIYINDGSTDKEVWAAATIASGSQVVNQVNEFIVFLRSGDSLKVIADTGDEIAIWHKQIADIIGS